MGQVRIRVDGAVSITRVQTTAIFRCCNLIIQTRGQRLRGKICNMHVIYERNTKKSCAFNSMQRFIRVKH